MAGTATLRRHVTRNANSQQLVTAALSPPPKSINRSSQERTMKGASHPKNDVSLNPSANESIRSVIDAVDANRRQFIKGGVSADGRLSPAGDKRA